MFKKGEILEKYFISTIIAFDIKDYSKSKDTLRMETKRDILRKAVSSVEKEYDDIKFKDVIIETGDGMIIVADTTLISIFLPFMKDVGETLKKVNSQYKEPIRVRGVLHFGNYRIVEAIDSMSVSNKSRFTLIGDGINEVARYIDCKPIKDFLNERKNDLVFGVSNEFYKNIIPDDKNKKYLKGINFQVKEYKNIIYLYDENNENIDTVEDEEIEDKNQISNIGASGSRVEKQKI